MDDLSLAVYSCSLSALVILLIFGVRLFSVSSSRREELGRLIKDQKPFFYEFGRKMDRFTRFLSLCSEYLSHHLKRLFYPKELVPVAIKKKYDRVSGYLNGYKKIENSGGCDGYWKEVNGYKDNLNFSEAVQPAVKQKRGRKRKTESIILSEQKGA